MYPWVIVAICHLYFIKPVVLYHVSLDIFLVSHIAYEKKTMFSYYH